MSVASVRTAADGVYERLAVGRESLARTATRLAPAAEDYATAEKLLPLVSLACIVVVACVPLMGSPVWTLRMSQGLYFGLLCLSLNLLVGTAGMVSFGHAMFMGIGAYAVAIPFRDHAIDPLYLLPLTPAAGALGAAVVGLVVLRGKALYFSLLTLGIAQLFWAIWHGWQTFTGGTNGISGIFITGWFMDTNNLYWFVFGCCALCTALLYVITKSPFGDALRAIRDNPRRAEFTGMWVKRYELTAFVIAGMFGAIAGGLFVFSEAAVTSDTLDWRKSAIALISVLIGGIGYFLGPFAGAIFWVYFRDQVVQLNGAPGLLWDTILGVIVLVVALVLRGGLVGLVHTLLAYCVGGVRRLQGREAREPEPPVEVVHLPSLAPAGSEDGAGPAAAAAPVVLEIEGVTKRFGGLVAVDGASISVRAGTIHAIIGPNGAGKSTLFNLVTGLYRPDEGRVLLEGEEITGKAAWRLVKRGMGRSFQQTNLFWTLPAIANVTVAGSAVDDTTLRPFGMHPAAVRDRGRQLLERVGLAGFSSLPAGQLSHGDQRSLEIATALAVDSRLLLLDEPTAGLSPSETKTAVELIKRIAREQKLTVLFVEHDMEVVFGIADWITVLHKGAVLAEGTPTEIRANEKVREAYLGVELAELDA